MPIPPAIRKCFLDAAPELTDRLVQVSGLTRDELWKMRSALRREYDRSGGRKQ